MGSAPSILRDALPRIAPQDEAMMLLAFILRSRGAASRKTKALTGEHDS